MLLPNGVSIFSKNMSLKRKRKSLADKISNLLTPAPVNFGSDDEAEETKAKVVENYDESDQSDADFRQSKFRKQNVDLLDQDDKRYEGKKVSRKDIYDHDSDSMSHASSEEEDSVDLEEGEEDDEDSDEDLSENSTQEESDQQDSEDEGEQSDIAENSKEESEESDSEEEEEDDDYDIMRHDSSSKNDEPDSKIKTMTDTNVKADIRKGNSVRNQLKIWENLLEFRIKLQKCLVTSNQLPQRNTYKSFRSDKEFVKKTNEAKNTLTNFLNNMLQLQTSLLGQYSETKKLNLTHNKQKGNNTEKNDGSNEDDDMDEEIPSDMDEEIPSDTEDEMKEQKESDANEEESKEEQVKVPQTKLKLSEYEKTLAARHAAYREYRNTVIQKWNDKTRVATGSVNKGTTQTVLKQIEFALSDKEKLRKRTQLKRSEYSILGKRKASDEDDGRRVQEYDPEIYDDDDFYHQLLRDLIEYKSSDVTDPIQLSKQWIQLQNMRSKMKRKIDTRATKGRKIRYNVHNKLVNFMAPITTYDTWTDHAKTELFNSLFGKIKPVEAKVEQ